MLSKKSKISAVFVITALILLIIGYNAQLFSHHRASDAFWRISVWKDAIVMIVDRPYFGHGANTFMDLFEFYRKATSGSPTYAHNCYLQIAVELGLLGLGAFVWMMTLLFKQALSVLTLARNLLLGCWFEILGLLSGVFGFLVQSFFDTTFYSLQLSVLFWSMAGLLWAYINIIQQENNSRDYETN